MTDKQPVLIGTPSGFVGERFVGYPRLNPALIKDIQPQSTPLYEYLKRKGERKAQGLPD